MVIHRARVERRCSACVLGLRRRGFVRSCRSDHQRWDLRAGGSGDRSAPPVVAPASARSAGPRPNGPAHGGTPAARLPQSSADVSATNGETTTAAMVASIMARRQVELVHNRAGANMAGGVASALLDAEGDMGLFEVDEFWLDRIVP